MTSGEFILDAAAVAGLAVQVINAIALGWGRQATKEAREALAQKADVSLSKLDEIHNLADGNLSRVTSQLEEQRTISTQALERIARLEKLLTLSIAKRPKS